MYGERSAEELAATRNVAGAVFALVAAGAGVVQAASGPVWLKITLSGIALVGAVIAVGFHVLERRAKRREREASQVESKHRLLSLLSPTVPGVRERVPLFYELSAYDLGVDVEAISPGEPRGEDPEPYLRRDRDVDLREALSAARCSAAPSMVVVHGPSKAGKSRTLHEAVSNDQQLRAASVLAPRDAAALETLLESARLLDLPVGPIILWLDDLERFVPAARRAMHRGALDALAAWPGPAVVLATAGGRGADQFAAVSIDDIYNDPRVRKVPLVSDLSEDEQSRVRERYPSNVAEEVIADGIGEYLVAARALARKLTEERHKPGEPACPEGAAVVWAAIDWARAGMTGPIPKEMLRALWAHYLRGRQPSDERFHQGLDWALEPLYRSIALLAETTGGYQAYDWIVAYADGELRREIDPLAWDHLLEVAAPEAALQLGITTYVRRSWTRAARALNRAQSSPEPYVASEATFILGRSLAEQGDLAGAQAAYQRAIDSGDPDAAPRAALALGMLLADQRDVAGARAAYQRAIDSGFPDVAGSAALVLGGLLEEHGDTSGACIAYQQAIDAGHTAALPLAARKLGAVYESRGDLAGARVAYQRAIDSGDPDAAPQATLALGMLLAGQEDVAGARAAYQRAIDSGHPDAAPRAALALGMLLADQRDVAGARAAYQRAIDSGHANAAPGAAGALGMLLSGQGDLEGARAAYQRAIDSGHPLAAPGAAVQLGWLLEEEGDPAGARVAYQHAIDSGDPDAAPQAALWLGRLLVKQGDVAGARVAFQQTIDSGSREVGDLARAALKAL